MKIEILTDYGRIDEFVGVAMLAGPSGTRDENIEKITAFVDNANTGARLGLNTGLAFCVLDDDGAMPGRGAIVGTLTVSECPHFGCAMMDCFAVLPRAQGRMIGKILLSRVRDVVASHSDYKYIIGSTTRTGKFYEALGIPKIGTVKGPHSEKSFYGIIVN